MPQNRLPPSTSLYLDLARVTAAMVVVLHHVFEPPFHHGGAHFPGRSAVIVFFVISGFVIAYTSDGEVDWRRYAISRLARIYSVAVPALLLSALLLTVQNRLPGVASVPMDWPALRLVISLLFANEFWNLAVAALTNGPYWSLCYEVWYYVLFGVVTYMRGWGRILVASAVVIMVGPRILLLMPVWILGVGTYHAMKSHRVGHPMAERLLFWLFTACLFLAMIKGTPVDLVSSRLRESLSDGYIQMGPVSLFIGTDVRFLSDWLLGLLFAACVYLSRRDLSAGREGGPFDRAWRAVVKSASSYTFSLYLYHAPVLVFAHALLAPALPPPVVPWSILVIIMLSTVLLGRVTEHRKQPWARAFGALLGRQSRSSA